MSESASETVKSWQSPSYPQRVHVSERARWEKELKQWESRINLARAELARAGGDPVRHRLYAQMLGARDQIAENARRLPTEVGDMYGEDHHRLDEAVAALNRLFAQWPASSRTA